MKTKRFFLNKLVRDNIVDLFSKEGITSTSFALEDDNDYLEALTQKLIEELQEVFSAESSEELVEELADIEDVLAAFKALLKLDPKDIEAAREKKLALKGSFSKRTFIESIDVPESNKERIAYFEAKASLTPDLNLDDLEDDEEEECDEDCAEDCK